MNLKNRLIITPRRHLQHYFQQHRQPLDSAWRTAPILTLLDWLTQLWQQHTPNPKVVLRDTEALLLWRDMIARARPALSPQQHAALAVSANARWKKSVLWQLPLTDLEWGPLFQQQLAEKNYITKIELMTAMALPLKQISLPHQIMVAGFHDRLPAMEHLFSTLQQCTRVTYAPLTDRNQTTHRIALINETAEITTMARWASTQLQLEHEKIACIIPDIAILSNRIDRIFSLHLPRAAYHIAITKPLQQDALIQTALHVLATRQPSAPLETLRALLLSPYINNSDADRCVAAMAQRILSQQSITTCIDPMNVYHILQGIHESHYPEATLTERWLAFSHYPLSTEAQRFDTWAPIFRDVLRAIGWPGQRALNEDEQHMMAQWENTLTYFSHLDHLLPPPDYASACHIINDVCRHITITPQKNNMNNAPIQIMGLLDAHDMFFNHAWVMGISDAHATHIPARLIANNTHVIFSHTAQSDPLLKNIAIITTNELALSPLSLSTAHTPLFSRPNDDQAPVLTHHEKTHRGSKILALQSACPFRAFATLRLRAEPSYPASVGLNTLEQGILCHHVLLIIWKKLGSQDALQHLTPEQQDTLIMESITEACRKTPIMQTYFLDLEKKRLHTLLNAWLNMEKKRPPFYIAALEKKYEITLGPLTFKIQIDRIDHIEDHNECIVIDYKTGITPSLSHWFNERIIEPQLPLYALLSDLTIDGVAYGAVNLNDLHFSGLVNTSRAFSKVYRTEDYYKNKFSWSIIKTAWESILTSLSYDFFNGHAAVDPRDLQTCKTCHLHALCRIHEQKITGE